MPKYYVTKVNGVEPDSTGNVAGIGAIGVPGGATTEIQFNNAGAFDATPNFKYIEDQGIVFDHPFTSPATTGNHFYDFIVAKPIDTAAMQSDFIMTRWSYDNTAGVDPVGIPRNEGLMMGFNLNSGGGIRDAGKPSLGESWENNYLPDWDPTHRYVEKHEYYIPYKTAGGWNEAQQVRLSSWTINGNTNDISYYQRSGRFWIYGVPNSDVQTFFAQAGNVAIKDGADLMTFGVALTPNVDYGGNNDVATIYGYGTDILVFQGFPRVALNATLEYATLGLGTVYTNDISIGGSFSMGGIFSITTGSMSSQMQIQTGNNALVWTADDTNGLTKLWLKEFNEIDFDGAVLTNTSFVNLGVSNTFTAKYIWTYGDIRLYEQTYGGFTFSQLQADIGNNAISWSTDAANMPRLQFHNFNEVNWNGVTMDGITNLTTSVYVSTPKLYVGVISFGAIAGDPTTSDIDNGFYNLIKNTTTGVTKLWYNDGGVMSSIGAGAAAGSDTQVQFNNSGVFGASSDFTFASNKLSLPTYSTTHNNLEVGSFGVQSYALNNGWISENEYHNGTDFKYRSTGYGGLIYFDAGNIKFQTAPSGSAGTTAANINALILANSGAATFLNSVSATSVIVNNNTADGAQLMVSDANRSLSGASQATAVKLLGTANTYNNLLHMDNNNAAGRPGFILSSSGGGNWEENFFSVNVHGTTYSHNYYITDYPSKSSDIGWVTVFAQGTFTAGMALFAVENVPLVLGTNNSARIIITGSGNISVGNALPNASAKLEVQSTTQGLLPPRMTTTQRDAIGTPSEGLQVHNLTTNLPNYYNGSAWAAVGAGAAAGSNTQIQFNNSGVFGASADFVWTGNILKVGNTTAAGTTTPTFLSIGGTYGTNTPGTYGNLKWRLYDTGSVYYGIGMSASNMEYQVPDGAVHTFYVSDTEVLKINSTDVLITGNAKVSAPANTTTSVVTIDGTQTLTNKRVNPRVASITSNATWSPSADNDDMYIITAQGVDATTISNPSGTPVNGQELKIRVKDDATARALTWSGSQWRASSDLALPTTTIVSKTLYMNFIWNSTDSKWDMLSLLNNF